METATHPRLSLPARAHPGVSTAVFTAAIFVSAFLLFWVQPLFSKMVLPALGGSPSVWNTAMMFFQLVLLAGYGYAHLLTTRVPRLGWQFAIHGVVVACGLFFLPLGVAHDLNPPSTGSPIPWLLGLLAVSVGWPFFALSASAPLLQAWFARSGHRQSNDPYFLYAASNLGSLLALLSFPVLIEPALTLAGQAKSWAFGYAGLLAILAVAGMFVLRSSSGATAPVATAAARSVDWRGRLVWIALAFVPSSLLLGVTTHITTDIASAPLFWVVPLALYLLSFVIAFSQNAWLKGRWLLTAQAAGILVVVTMMLLALIFERGGSVLLVAVAHLATFFVTAILCHTELARRRPEVGDLTSFYFCMSIGGAAGGVFNALIAPVVFSSDYEYYLVLIAACALRVFAQGQPKTFVARDLIYPLVLAPVVAGIAYLSIDAASAGMLVRMTFLIACAVVLYFFAERPFRFALGVAAVTGGALLVQGSVDVLHTERNFFGVIKVKQIDGASKMAFIHGTTMHGTEFVAPKLRREPLAYYARSGPVGQFFARSERRQNVAAIGLGTGALACYRRPGERWTFFEIDGAVEKIARDTRYFHYLADCGGSTKVVLGDGRLSLKAMPDRSYDLVILDAFSSDSIPVHLLTKEALQLYLAKLKPKGSILVNISNEYLELLPVVTSLIGSVGATGKHELFYPHPEQVAQGATGSEWVAIAARPDALGFLKPEKRWSALNAAAGAQPWSDDFSNVFGAIRW